MDQKTSAKITEVQEFIIQIAENRLNRPLSAKVREAFFAQARHEFVSRYRSHRESTWVEINSFDDIKNHLSMLYSDQPLLIFASDQDLVARGGRISTISQPSFVLQCLEMLDLGEGQRVLEIGTGSGWNAALMGHIVGPKGLVVSIEIIPELARDSAQRLELRRLSQVKIVEGDARKGWVAEAPYDRVIFTAAAESMPEAIFSQTREGAKILFVRKGTSAAATDRLLVLEKKNQTLKEISELSCAFVPMT